MTGQLVCQASDTDLILILYGHYFNALICDPQIKRMDEHIRFSAWGGLNTDLIVTPEQCLAHIGADQPAELSDRTIVLTGGTMPIEHEGQIINVLLPTWDRLFGDLRLHKFLWLGIDKKRLHLSALLSALSSSTGGPTVEFVPPDVPWLEGSCWEAFKDSMRTFALLFERCRAPVQQMCAKHIQCYAAGQLVYIAVNTADIKCSRSLLQKHPPSACIEAQEKAFCHRENLISLVAEELQLVMRLYWVYHYEKMVMPGDGHDPIIRLLPPAVSEHLPRTHKPKKPTDLPVTMQESAMAKAVAGLCEILPGNPILNHPRIQFYLSLGAKKVYSTTFFGRDDYYAIPIKAASGLILIVLVSLHEGHTADYFVEAGRSGDPPEILLRWTHAVQFSRKRLRHDFPEIYRGKVRHFCAFRKPRIHAASATTQPKRRQAMLDRPEGIRWHNEARRLLARF